MRGYSDRHVLAGLWQLIEESGDWDNLVWEDNYASTPVDTKGDLVDWVFTIENPHDPAVLLMGVEEETNKIVGLVWFKQIKPHKANAAIWVKPEYRGAYSRELVDLGLKHAFEVEGWEVVFAATPHHIARNLIKKSGFQDQAKIQDIFYLTCEKENFYGKRRGRDTRKPNGQTAGQEA